MGTLLRSTALWGYRELVRELGGDPEEFLARFGIPRGIERQDDAFISYAAFVHLLETSADELDCPDFALRLSQWQGLDILGPVAVIARNAHTVLDGWQAIAGTTSRSVWSCRLPHQTRLAPAHARQLDASLQDCQNYRACRSPSLRYWPLG